MFNDRYDEANHAMLLIATFDDGRRGLFITDKGLTWRDMSQTNWPIIWSK